MKGATSRVRREYLDQDYIHLLSEEEKQWLSNFNEEWLGGNFKHEGEVLHKTVEEQRALWRKNNRQNNDVQGVTKARGHLVYTEDAQDAVEDEVNRYDTDPESALIEIIDRTRKKS